MALKPLEYSSEEPKNGSTYVMAGCLQRPGIQCLDPRHTPDDGLVRALPPPVSSLPACMHQAECCVRRAGGGGGTKYVLGSGHGLDGLWPVVRDKLCVWPVPIATRGVPWDGMRAAGTARRSIAVRMHSTSPPSSRPPTHPPPPHTHQHQQQLGKVECAAGSPLHWRRDVVDARAVQRCIVTERRRQGHEHGLHARKHMRIP